jgi:hypothetical protein
LCNELICALLESGNGSVSSADVKDAIKLLSTMKTNEDGTANGLAASLTDTQLQEINAIINCKDKPIKEKVVIEF